MQIREDALQRFSPAGIRAERPLATLEDVLVPLYFLHRYQTEAVSKLLAGVEYNYQTRDGWQDLPTVISGEMQQQALDLLLRTIAPETLRVPDSVLRILPPRRLHLPLLPLKINGKLMFPLCLQCAEEMRQSRPCDHCTSERALTGTYTSYELEKAVELGYKVLRIFEVWQFD